MDMDNLGLSGSAARKILEGEGITAPSVRILGYFFIPEDYDGQRIWRQSPNFNILVAQVKPHLKDGGFFEHPPTRLMHQQRSA